MKKIFFIVALLGCALVYLQQQSYAEKKTVHTEYAKMEIRECNSCHKGEGVGINHDTDWLRGHKVVAGKAGNNCKECHQQSWCLDCHQGGGSGMDLGTENFGRDYKPKSHRSNFRTMHPLKAKDNPQTCTRCHDQKYCTGCHSKYKRSNLQFDSHRTQFTNIPINNLVSHGSFDANSCQGCHPGGYIPKHAWSSDHAREARRNLQSCQTCHDSGDVCIKCHSARTGLKISPHPRSWGSISENLKSRSNGRSCIKCHDKY